MAAKNLGPFMHRPAPREKLHAGHGCSLLAFAALAVVMALAWSGATAGAQSADKKARSRNSAGVPRARRADEQGRRPRNSAHRKARPGNARHGSDTCPELSSFRLRGDPRHGIQRAEVRRQSLSSAHSPGISRRKADRPFRERPHRPDYPGLLHSAVHAQRSVRSALPGADDLVTDKSPHAWSSHQSEGKC